MRRDYTDVPIHEFAEAVIKDIDGFQKAVVADLNSFRMHIGILWALLLAQGVSIIVLAVLLGEKP